MARNGLALLLAVLSGLAFVPSRLPASVPLEEGQEVVEAFVGKEGRAGGGGGGGPTPQEEVQARKQNDQFMILIKEVYLNLVCRCHSKSCI